VKGYLVDTNIPSELTREGPDARVAAFLKNAGKESVFLSVMTIGEICKGIDLLPVSKKRSGLQIWLDNRCAFLVCREDSRCHRIHRRTLGPSGRSHENNEESRWRWWTALSPPRRSNTASRW
jgi:predicted nucleic acid-binding protein